MSAAAPAARVLEAGTLALSRHLGAPVALVPGSVPEGPPKPVFRCHLDQAPAGAPETVILKHLPPTPAGTRPPGLLNEWAALRFLSDLGLDPPVSPALYGADPEAGVLVLEDLGDGDSLAKVLLGQDAAQAEVALVSFARALGRMQAAAAPRLVEYRGLRESLGPPGGEAIIAPVELAARFEAALRSAEVSLGRAVEDVDAVIDRVGRPGPFLALVHGDACPSNERLLERGAVLLDFATAGLRHALLDGVCGRVPFPSCWCARRLPPRLPALMEESYRTELMCGLPGAADDERFASESLAAIAYWLIETTSAALASTPFRDLTWGTATLGERIAHRVELFCALAEEAASYTSLAEVLARLVERLGLASTRMPLYPAFGGPPVPGASAAPD